MPIRAITEILQDLFQRDVSKILEGNTKKPKYTYVNKAFFSFDIIKTHSTIRNCPTILHSEISTYYIKYFRIHEVSIKVHM
jgi:hypothetical protein